MHAVAIGRSHQNWPPISPSAAKTADQKATFEPIPTRAGDGMTFSGGARRSCHSIWNIGSRIRHDVPMSSRRKFAAFIRGWATVGLSLSLLVAGLAAEPPGPSARIDALLGQLKDTDFGVRLRAERELSTTGVAAIDALERAAIGDAENGTRVVSVLERLYVGDAVHEEEHHLARAACLGSGEALLSLRRIGGFGETELTRAAESALERLADGESDIASYADAALERHALLRENRAIARLRRFGARIVFDDHFDLIHDAISSATSEPFGIGDDDAVSTPEPRLIAQVYMLPRWTGGQEGLGLLKRLRTSRTLFVYVIDGGPITADQVRSIASEVPGILTETRGSGTLGISSSLTGNCEIGQVIEGMAGKRADLRYGDVIEEVDGQPVATFHDLTESLRPHSAGDVVTLKIRRGGLPNFESPPSNRDGATELEKPVTLSDWSDLPDFMMQSYGR
jgi:hypothetical protein